MGGGNYLSVYEKVEVTDIGAGGIAVAKTGSLVIFLAGAVPGDIADIQIVRRKRNYLEGVPVKFHKMSPDRKPPLCEHFGVCGGCSWQCLKYEKQLFFKEKSVKDAMERLAKTEVKKSHQILGSPQQYYYRNKLEYTFSERKWLTAEEIKTTQTLSRENALGFHKPGHFDRVID
ncbi:MAG: TRAM domain-containing protein, partial [Bacteroidales bacterium]